MVLPLPNVILFQYNPATVSRTLSAFDTSGGPETTPQPAGPGSSDRAQPHDPPESITLSLELDATDALETPEFHPIAFVSGVADRLSALEMLLYPEDDPGGGLAATISGSLGGVGALLGGALGGGGAAKDLTKPQVPVVFFVWGPGRIVPVRLNQFTVEEQQFNQLLYATRAKVSVGMKILTEDAIRAGKQKTSTTDDLAIFAYKYTRKQKQVLALANLANAAESILGLLPI
jgi:hypothetical protein